MRRLLRFHYWTGVTDLMLDSRKTGIIRLRGRVIPVASEIKRPLEGRCFPVLRPPVFDTTPPGVGGRLKPRCARHGNLTPPRIAPSRPQAGVSLYADEVVAKQLVRCFWTGGYRSPPYLAVFDGETPQAGLGAPSRVACSSGNVFQSPDVTGRSPVFFKVHRGYGTTPSLLSRVREGVDRENF